MSKPCGQLPSGAPTWPPEWVPWQTAPSPVALQVYQSGGGGLRLSRSTAACAGAATAKAAATAAVAARIRRYMAPPWWCGPSRSPSVSEGSSGRAPEFGGVPGGVPLRGDDGAHRAAGDRELAAQRGDPRAGVRERVGQCHLVQAGHAEVGAQGAVARLDRQADGCGKAKGAGYQAVDRRLGPLARPSGRQRLDSHLAVPRLDQREHRLRKAALGERDRVDAVRGPAEVVAHDADSSLRFVRARRAFEREPECQQALLRAVVQVALEAPPLGVAGVDETGR